MDSEQEARREAEQAAADDRLMKLAEAIGGSASAKAVFGDPVERDGVTVIPVARVRYGMGGGMGRGAGRRRGRRNDGDGSVAAEGAVGAETMEYGSGAGGGVQAGPIGYIELRDGRASFERISDPVRTVTMMVLPLSAMALGAAVLFLLRDRLRGGG